MCCFVWQWRSRRAIVHVETGYRTHLNSNPSMNGSLPYITTLQLQAPSSLQPNGIPVQTGPPGLPPGPPGPTGSPSPPGPPDPTGLPIPMPLRPVPVRPVMYQQHFPMPPPSFNAPPMQSLLSQELPSDMLRNASHQDNTHTETSQPSNVTTHVQSHQPLMPSGLLLPERHYYPRNVLTPEDIYKKYMAVYQPGYQASLPAVLDSHYNGIDALPAEPRHVSRVNPNYALVNGDRYVEPTWKPINEAFFDGPTKVTHAFQSDTEDMFASALAEKRLNNAPCNRADDKELEEELEALVRRIDTDFKNAD